MLFILSLFGAKMGKVKVIGYGGGEQYILNPNHIKVEVPTWLQYNDLLSWLEDNIQEDCILHSQGFFHIIIPILYFNNEDDAILFKLTWYE